MSTKTIALDARVYDRLAAEKKEGESFSRAIDRILSAIQRTSTGQDILAQLGTLSPLPAEEAAVFMSVIEEDRAADWDER